MRSQRWSWGLGLVGLLGVPGIALAATFYVDATLGDDTITDSTRTGILLVATSASWRQTNRWDVSDNVVLNGADYGLGYYL